MLALPMPSPARDLEHAEREVNARFEAWFGTPLASEASRKTYRAYLDALVSREDAVARANIQDVKEGVVT